MIILLYGSRLGTNIRIVEVTKEKVGDQYIYRTIYEGSKGIFEIDSEINNDLDFDVKKFEEAKNISEKKS